MNYPSIKCIDVDTDVWTRGLSLPFNHLITKIKNIKLFKFQIFFGTIRAAGGQNDHPAMPNFQHIYKMLSVYSILKPPKSGNCTAIEHNKNLIKLEELKNIFDKPKATEIDLIKEKLNESLLNIDDIHEIEVRTIQFDNKSISRTYVREVYAVGTFLSVKSVFNHRFLIPCQNH